MVVWRIPWEIPGDMKGFVSGEMSAVKWDAVFLRRAADGQPLGCPVNRSSGTETCSW